MNVNKDWVLKKLVDPLSLPIISVISAYNQMPPKTFRPL